MDELYDNELCERCLKNPAQSPHVCPYGVEINDDHDECTCCDVCTQNCADDV